MKRRPRTGEKRIVRQPFVIDKLSPEVRAEIQRRKAAGETWQEISDASKEFAPRPLAVGTLQRWYDVRVEQVQRDVMAQAERSRAIAAEFAGKGFDNLPASVQSALSSAVFSLAESSAESDRGKFLKAMNDLAWLLARNRQLDQEAERLAIERGKLEAIAAKVKGLKQAVDGKKKVTPEELKKRIDEIYGISAA